MRPFLFGFLRHSCLSIIPFVAALSVHGQAPAPWAEADVGNTGVTGSVAHNNNFFSVFGGGADIWGTADGFHFVYQQVSGDFDFTSVVNWVAYTDAWAKSGLMVRQDLSAGAANALVFVTPGSGLGFQWRSVAGGNTQWQPGGGGSAPVYVRLVRTGNTISAYRSATSTGWTLIGSTTLNLGTTAYVGMAVTSHRYGVRGEGQFDRPTLNGGSGGGGGGAPLAPSDLVATVVSSNEINLVWNWTSNSTLQTWFETQRSTNGTTFQIVRTDPAASGTTYFNDTGLTPDTHYWYRVRATNSAGASPWSNVAEGTTAAVGPDLPAPWVGQPIGAMAGRGDATYANGVFRVTGNGTDIWGNYDNFYFVHQQVEGDFSITARVTGMSPADSWTGPLEPWAKAGVMIRDFLPPDTRNVMVFVSPQHGVGMQWRSTIGYITEYVPGPSFTFTGPIWLKLTRTEHTYSGFWSLDGQDWRLIGAIQLVTPPGMEAGMAVTSHRYGARMTASFANVGISTSGGGGGNPLPAPWQNQDIGAVGIPGEAAYTSGAFTVNGSGADIWGTADAFHYVYQPWTGDGQITARIRRVPNQFSPHPWAKAGLMFRESTAANAANVFMMVTPASGTGFQTRHITGANSGWIQGPYSTEGWARVVRSGNVFTAYWSNDGVNWTTVGSHTHTMGAQVLVGLAVTSHDNASVLTSEFSNVVVGPR